MREQIALASAVLVLTHGCASVPSRPQPKTFARQDQAGTTNIAVLSVDTWDSYIAQLQPKFKISEAGALAEVDQVRRSIESTFVDAMSAGLRLAPPTSSSTATTTDSATETLLRETVDGESTSTSTEESERSFSESTERGPGDVSSVSLPSGAAGLATSPTLAPATPEIGGLEPMLRYQAATALFQEIRLLSWYLEKAVMRSNYVPYVVRANITVTPKARNEPYDTYLNLSFFSQQGAPTTVPDGQATNEVQKLIQSYDPKDEDGESFRGRDLTTLQQPEIEELRRLSLVRSPFVIPLLVTDSLESTIHTNVVDQVRQLAFSLLFMVQGFGGQAQYERFRRNLERTTGRDLNSLMTVSRLSDNTYRVRLGAMQQVATANATIPRNHFITFLLLVPCGVQEVTVGSSADWVHSRTGISLAPRPDDELRRQLLEVATGYEETGFINPDSAREFADRLFWVHANDYLGFKLIVDGFPDLSSSPPIPEFPYQALWVQLMEMIVGSRRASTTFQLPAQQETEVSTNAATVMDDGAVSRVQIAGKALRDGKMVAVLKANDKTLPGLVVPIDASSIAVTADRSRATVTFPSLKKLSGANDNLTLVPKVLEIVCVGCARSHCGPGASRCATGGGGAVGFTIDTSTTNDVCRAVDLDYLLTKKDEVKPGFSVSATASAVVTDETGRGSVKLLVAIQESGGTKKCDKVEIGLSGAGVAAVTADPTSILPATGKTLQVVGTGTLNLDLTNLTPAMPTVSVSGKCLAGAGKGATADGPQLRVVMNPTRAEVPRAAPPAR